MMVQHQRLVQYCNVKSNAITNELNTVDVPPQDSSTVQVVIEELTCTSLSLVWVRPETAEAGVETGAETSAETLESTTETEIVQTTEAGDGQVDDALPSNPDESQDVLNVFIQLKEFHAKDFSERLQATFLRDESYAIQGLVPDTRYTMTVSRDIDDDAVIPLKIDFTTLEEGIFMLDDSACGENLEIRNSFTVKNTMSKKWNAVRCTRGYSSGVHAWDVHIDKCASKNIFIGVVEVDASLDNYVGSDPFGWGYLANKALWHNRSKVKEYGELYTEGDSIGIRLDMDAGTLSFSRNGRNLGVAVQGLCGELYPCLSMYNQDDQLTLIPTVDPQGSFDAGPGGACIYASVQELFTVHELLTGSILGKRSMQEKMKLLQPIHELYQQWKKDDLERVETIDNKWISINKSEKACCLFGYTSGDTIYSAKGPSTVIGTAQHCLWYRLNDNNVHCWSLKTCREMKARPEEFPMTPRTHRDPTTDDDTSTSEIADSAEVSSQWTLAHDIQLIEVLDRVANQLGYPFPWCLRSCDVVQSSLEEYVGADLLPLTFLDNLSSTQLGFRIVLLTHLNMLFYENLPYLNLEDFSSSHSSSSNSELSSLFVQHKALWFTSSKAHFFRTLLLHSSTPTPSMVEGFFDDPPEITKIVLNKPKIGAPSSSLFQQFMDQIAAVEVHELRRHFIGRNVSYEEVQERTLHFTFGDYSTNDQDTVYKYALTALCKELESSRFPLFHRNDDEKSLEIKTYSTWNFNLPHLEQAVFAFGQFLGIALRGNIPLPLHLSKPFWTVLVHGETESEAMLSDEKGFQMQTCFQKGFESIIPFTFLVLFTEMEMEMLCSIPSGVDIQRLMKCTTIEDHPTALSSSTALWRILESMNVEERQLFFLFVCGENAIPPPEDHWRLFIVHAEMEECPRYPIAVRRDNLTTLQLPEYSCSEQLHERLLSAISNCPSEMDEDEEYETDL